MTQPPNIGWCQAQRAALSATQPTAPQNATKKSIPTGPIGFSEVMAPSLPHVGNGEQAAHMFSRTATVTYLRGSP